MKKAMAATLPLPSFFCYNKKKKKKGNGSFVVVAFFSSVQQNKRKKATTIKLPSPSMLSCNQRKKKGLKGAYHEAPALGPMWVPLQALRRSFSRSSYALLPLFSCSNNSRGLVMK
jgi:hypothetical protein